MRTFRSGGLEASTIGLGCASMSGLYGPSDDISSMRLIHHALDKGVNFFDTADSYGWGHNEELLGRAIGARRNKAVIATKFGSVKLADGTIDYNGRPEFVSASCDASLRRLKIETIDLYYQMRVDPNVPIEDTVGAMAELVKLGKVRLLGLSEAHPNTIRRANSVHPITAIQSEYSLLYRAEAEETRAITRGLGLAFVAYSPLGRSFLAAQVQDVSDVAGDRRGQHPRFQGENFATNRELVRRLELIALDKGCTAAQLALAWLLAQGSDVLPIPGTKHRERFDENLGALSVQLTPQDLDRIRAAIPIGTASGLRYPEPTMKNVYV
jgi:aryl-alcohol dehydrogenase-like predicted oxidoreductase